LTNQLSPLLDAGYLEETLRRHFEPLFDSAFDDLLRRHYRNGVAFEVDGREMTRVDLPGSDRVRISIRLGRRRTPSATGFIERNSLMPADREGIAISTFGKVIKRGWDWLGLAPAARAHIIGLIEAPDLAACLTLSKNDFIRSGARGASYLAYRKAIQEVVSRRSPSGAMRATRKRGRAPRGSSGISSACSRISQTTFRCCGRWSIAAPAGRSACRCRAGAMNASRRRSSRTCPSTNPQAMGAPRPPLREARRQNNLRGRPRQSRGRRRARRRRSHRSEIGLRPKTNL